MDGTRASQSHLYMFRISEVVQLVDEVKVQEHSSVLKNRLPHILVDSCHRQSHFLEPGLVYDECLSDRILPREHSICHLFRNDCCILLTHHCLRISVLEVDSEEIEIVATNQDRGDVHLLLSGKRLYILSLSVVCAMNDDIAPVFYLRHLRKYHFWVRFIET